MHRGIRVYVAGPYTKPDPCENTHEAVRVGNVLLDEGFVPYIPHLTHFWHTMTPKPYKVWTDLDLFWIDPCAALLRFPGESKGADAEVKYAEDKGIPVFYSVGDLIAHFDSIGRLSINFEIS